MRGELGWRGRLLVAACLLSGTVLTFDGLLVEPSWVEARYHLEYVRGWTPGTPEVTLVHLSDLHLGPPGEREREAIALINAARPDLIAVTGDLVHRGADPQAIGDFLAALHPRVGGFVVWGNHDHWSGVADRRGAAIIERAGFTLLDNEHRRVSTAAGPLVIAGIDDPVSGHDNLARALADVARDEVALLLAHSPEIVRTLGHHDVDLVLAGHTHGGQVRLPLLGAILLPPGTRPFDEGWFDVDGGARLHVSSGLGWSFLPVRLLCRPRIDVITLHGGAPPATPHRRRAPLA